MTEYQKGEVCFLCEDLLSSSPGIYEGRNYPCYDFAMCISCYNGGLDGLNPKYNSKIEEHCKARGINLPEKNENNSYPREF